jgi:hypothetical protein
MASESSMRSRVVRALRDLDAIPVENGVLPGTPDVAFIGGWIELKSEDAWPKRADTILSLKRYTPLQRLWLRRHCRRGGNAWLLLRVGKEWLVFSGQTASDIVGLATRAQLIAASVKHWPQTPSDEDLLAMFDRRQNVPQA